MQAQLKTVLVLLVCAAGEQCAGLQQGASSGSDLPVCKLHACTNGTAQLKNDTCVLKRDSWVVAQRVTQPAAAAFTHSNRVRVCAAVALTVLLAL
jgi:hypothetical protein